MDSPDLEAAFNEAFDRIEAVWDDPESHRYRRALEGLLEVAESGSDQAAEAVAEIFALSGPHHDPEAAYRWYFIALSQQGYSVEFKDQNNDPPYYGGPVGDFRNESMVSELVTELGFDRIQELDILAGAWLREHEVFHESET